MRVMMMMIPLLVLKILLPRWVWDVRNLLYAATHEQGLRIHAIDNMKRPDATVTGNFLSDDDPSEIITNNPRKLGQQQTTTISKQQQNSSFVFYKHTTGNKTLHYYDLLQSKQRSVPKSFKFLWMEKKSQKVPCVFG
jgi:hypothetical protein